MMNRLRYLCIYSACVAVLAIAAPSASAAINFADDIAPIFREHCNNCHNPDKKKGDLDLSSYSGMMAGSSSGEVVEAGNADFSTLYLVTAHAESPKMPPKKAKIPQDQIDKLKAWITEGIRESSGAKAVVARKRPSIALNTAPDGKPTGEPIVPGQILEEPTVHPKRNDAITAMAHSPWAPVLAIAGERQIAIYHSGSLDVLGVLPFPEGTPEVLRFSRNGSLLMVAGGLGGKRGIVVVYDVKTGERVATVGDEFDSVLAADIAPQQTLVVLGGPAKVVKGIAIDTGKVTWTMEKHTEWIQAVAFSPDGVLVASGDRNGGLRVSEAFTGQPFYDLRGHKGPITDIAFRGDSNVVASVSKDGTVKLWNMHNGSLIKSWGAHGGGVLAVSFTHDGRIVTAGRDKRVKIWKADGAHLRDMPALPHFGTSVTFNHDGTRVIAGDWTGAVRVFNAADGKPIGELDANPSAIADRLASAEKQLSDLSAKVASLAPSEQPLVAAVDAKAKQHAAAVARHAELEKLIKQLEPQIKPMDAKLKQHDATLKTARDLHNRENNEAAKHAKQRDAAQRERDDTKKRFDQRVAALNTAKTKADAAAKQVQAKAAEFAAAEKQAKEKPDDAGLAKRAEQLRQQHTQLDQQHKTAAQAVATAEADRVKHENQVKAAEAKLAGHVKQANDANAKLAAAEAKMKQANDARTAVVAERKALHDKFNGSRTEHGALAKAIPNHKAASDGAAAKLAEYRAVVAQRTAATVRVNELKLAGVYTGLYWARDARNAKELAKLQADSDANAARAALDAAHARIKSVERFIAEAPTKVKAAEQGVVAAKVKLDTAVAARAAALKARDARNAELAPVVKQIVEADAGLKAKTAELPGVETQIKPKRDAVNRANAAVAAKLKPLKDVQGKVKAADAVLVKATADHAAAAKQVDAANVKLKASMDALKAAVADRDAKAKAIIASREQRDAAQAALVAAQKAAAAKPDDAALAESVKQAMTKRDQLAAATTQAEAARTVADKKVADVETARKKDKAHVDAMNGKARQLASAQKNAQNGRNKFNGWLGKATAEHRAAADSAAKLVAELKAVEARIASIKKSQQELTAKIAALNKQADPMRAALATSEKTLAEAVKTADAAGGAHVESSAALVQLRDRMTAGPQTLVDARSNVPKAQMDLKAAEAKAAAAIAELAKADAEVKRHADAFAAAQAGK